MNNKFPYQTTDKTILNYYYDAGPKKSRVKCLLMKDDFLMMLSKYVSIELQEGRLDDGLFMLIEKKIKKLPFRTPLKC